MSHGTAIECAWDGHAFKPTTPFWTKLAARNYAAGEVLRMVDDPAPSSNSRRHYFAALNQAWENMPERLLEQYPSVEVLRKHTLIREGYCDESRFVCNSHAEALRFSAFLAPIDPYSIVVVKECVVVRRTAQSQNLRSMGQKAFQESKDKVLDHVAAIVGTTRYILAAQAKAA